MGDQEIVERLRKVSLAEVAASLGLPIQRRGKRVWTNCLFHQDRKPSMALHQLPSDDWRYRCFSCGATGDVFDLVQKVDACDFRTALEKVASMAGVTLPKRRKKSEPKLNGTEVALRYYAQQTKDETRRLKEWAKERSLRPSILNEFSITYARNQKLSTTVTNREEIGALRDAQLIFQPLSTSSRQPDLEMNVPDRDAMIGDRIIFPVRDFNGVPQGYFGRTPDAQTQPRYQFTRYFPKSQVLFGLDVARKSLKMKLSANEDGDAYTELQLYIVEGATDALRLHQLGLDAVAVMGSDLSADQAKLVRILARELGAASTSLTVRLFFDGDNAGEAATRNALTKLLALLAEQALFGIEIVLPTDDDSPYRGSDPDTWLVNATKRNALRKIKKAIVSVGRFLMAYGFRCEIDEIESRWRQSAMTQRYAALRRVDNLLPKKEWKGIFGALGEDLFNTSSSSADVLSDESAWKNRLTEYLCRSGSNLTATGTGDIPRTEQESTKITHAIQIAHHFSQRREFPVDPGSWERLLGGVNVTTPYLVELLNQGAEACNVEPLLGMSVPKQSGKERLKAIPCAEQLAIQQYLLNELLGSSIQSTEFEECIPAVRSDGGVLRTTGLRSSMAVRAVCFSYQIDMEIVRNEKPPGNEGFFRPYRDCWSDFVEYLSRKVQTNNTDPFDDRPFYVARLDVRAYYDTVRRVCVDRILFDPLLEAIKSLDEPSQFAPSFRSSVTNATERAREFIDVLCQQSFGYAYVDPDSGEEKKFKNGASIGMPQGPSLSAYLGSIALFELDETVQAAVEEGESGIAYARYVDDMVLITRSKSSLDQLRAIVQKQLGLIGLELSSKVEPLPPMNAVQVLFGDNWFSALATTSIPDYESDFY
ncbi:DNA primase [Stieleria neptunia]|uniref:DNA primase n=1 Tax=Stieleria neptunia TaxID=2527979 RepID=A0A518HNZ2_9BACT|nr:CHC2 zinc finger domain-containing protein [Stieleria neptunia]QDV42497.1 DNA primase [Stieleria neptunia]